MRSSKRRVRTGGVAECFHRIAVHSGDTMFLPSGRVHAIGAGLVIFEIQQSSDTTYRVFDWNRLGLDGKPRDLHVEQSLASIDFMDKEPSLVDTPFIDRGMVAIQALVRDPLFSVDRHRALGKGVTGFGTRALRVAAVVTGQVTVTGGGASLQLDAGQFGVIPASLTDAAVAFEGEASFLIVEAG